MLGLDYVRTARAKGLAERTVVLRHAIRNALLPVVTVIGLQLGALLSGAVLTETIFNLAGVGRTLYEAITGRDYVVIQGFTLVDRGRLRGRQPGRRHLLRVPRPAGPARDEPSRDLTTSHTVAARSSSRRSTRPTERARPACGATRCAASCASARRSSA